MSDNISENKKKDSFTKDNLDDIYSSSNLRDLYTIYRNKEIEGFEILKQADSDYKGVLNRDNVNDVIAAIRAKKESRK